jgi:hypothetical protein
VKATITSNVTMIVPYDNLVYSHNLSIVVLVSSEGLQDLVSILLTISDINELCVFVTGIAFEL